MQKGKESKSPVRCKDDVEMYYKAALWMASKNEVPYFRFEAGFGILGDDEQCASLGTALSRLRTDGLLEKRERQINYMTSVPAYKATEKGRERAQQFNDEDKKNDYPVLMRFLAMQFKRQLRGTELDKLSIEECEEALRKYTAEKHASAVSS